MKKLFILSFLLFSLDAFASTRIHSGSRVGADYPDSTFAKSCRVAWNNFLGWADGRTLVLGTKFEDGNYRDIGTPYESYTCILTVHYTTLSDGEPNDSCHLNGTCELPEDPASCDSQDVQKQVQIEQYKCELTNPETEFFRQVFRWWCEEGNIYTHCSYEPKDCIQGLTCTKPSDDIPICDPNKQDCALPEPDPETPGQPDDPIIPPNPPVNPDLPPTNLCEQFPELCADPEPPTPPEPPVPNPDVPSDPDAPTDDKLLNEAIESNNHLTNIGEFIKSNTSKLGDLLVQNNIIGQHQLGKLNDILNKTFGGGAGGIGSTISQGNEIAKEGNEKLGELGDKLDDIACELDDDCADKEQPTANVDCEQSIFECKGDVIQCALLKIEYENSCATDEFAQLEKEMNAAFGVDNVGALVDPEELDFSNIDSKYLSNGVSFGNAGCPAPETHTFSHFAGSSTIEISYEPACHYAKVAAPIHVILAWISGLLLIGRTQGAF
ncbi:hypothetical protein GNT15_18835 [Vibrio parahaemolyticus]|nr:hypothetical protein [Vibrio parahaemolyticus]